MHPPPINSLSGPYLHDSDWLKPKGKQGPILTFCAYFWNLVLSVSKPALSALVSPSRLGEQSLPTVHLLPEEKHMANPLGM